MARLLPETRWQKTADAYAAVSPVLPPLLPYRQIDACSHPEEVLRGNDCVDTLRLLSPAAVFRITGISLDFPECPYEQTANAGEESYHRSCFKGHIIALLIRSKSTSRRLPIIKRYYPFVKNKNQPLWTGEKRKRTIIIPVVIRRIPKCIEVESVAAAVFIENERITGGVCKQGMRSGDKPKPHVLHLCA